jgi:hypothetical protein
MIRTLAIGFGLTAIFATTGLNATTFYSAKVMIPFEFKVGKISLAAGEYRVEQEFGKDVATVVNLKTGHRIQMLRPVGEHTQGRAKLLFENRDGVRILKRVS